MSHIDGTLVAGDLRHLTQNHRVFTRNSSCSWSLGETKCASSTLYKTSRLKSSARLIASMLKCVLMFHRGKNCTKIPFISMCLLLCLASISGIYRQMQVANVIMNSYYQVTSSQTDDLNDVGNVAGGTHNTTGNDNSVTQPSPTVVPDHQPRLVPNQSTISPLPMDLSRRFNKNITPNTYYSLKRPTNLRLVIMGDSISRYQYISLVYFLQTGTWINDTTTLPLESDSVLASRTPLHCKTPGIKARERFYSLSHSLLQPNEILCDGRAYSENRYYVDTKRNNYVTFITKFGKNSTLGRYLPHQINVNVTATTKKRRSDQWEYEYWNETIHYHIAKLRPKPQFLLFNAGLHKHDLHFQYIRRGIMDATKRHGIIPIYKTTTYPNNRSIGFQEFPLAQHDSLLCSNDDDQPNHTSRPYCLDMSWTSQLYGDDHYYDYYHFKPYWNYYMNLQTLLYLQEIRQQQERHDGNATTNNMVVPSVFRSNHVEQMIRA